MLVLPSLDAWRHWPPRFVIVWPFHSPVIARSACRGMIGFHRKADLQLGMAWIFTSKSWMLLPMISYDGWWTSCQNRTSCCKRDDQSKGWRFCRVVLSRLKPLVRGCVIFPSACGTMIAGDMELCGPVKDKRHLTLLWRTALALRQSLRASRWDIWPFVLHSLRSCLLSMKRKHI